MEEGTARCAFRAVLCLQDNIYVEVDGSGGLVFGVRREEEAQVGAGGAWIPNQAHLYLFTAPRA